MKKLIFFWKPVVILLVSFGLAGFLFCGSDDDDKSCGDAAANAVNIIMATTDDLDAICNYIYYQTPLGDEMTYTDYEYCQSIDDPVQFRTELTQGVVEWCTDEPWDQAGIDCVAGAGTVEQLEACYE